ncbi:NtaA/DmoA family FMN-dependent monooxygenase [Herbiconiux flava]|uniref:FMN-dependent oxidoreductase (Nitrilotriacetate monooxygenase family) n=1 Tax=Herbiconiux flava TaxID=881268 RepID=A0A852SQT9_9MICO|nr:NtaA/DmoA family FMN-dependent monooxygenase [Herbiconiux flava]NYD71201.1 FMN-dependent oxidoreductase (nitrilotriacetate monooxygenase family) [Herbiconiux flava]GLK18835.1 N5,N10-methylene tetrahydromethanopterin reductase [Herbiconiux flava]
MQPLLFGIFQYIGPNGTVGSAWQHPDDTSAEFTKLSHWTALAKKFEEARLDFLFLADSYGFPALEGQLIPASVREGRGIPHGDPMPLVSALAAVTEKLGFILTTSTTVEPPAANARRFATLDHFTDGRIGWNIVTGSSGATAAALMGNELIRHDLRYDMADDYVDVSLTLWESSWEDDALVLDKAAGVYADPEKVHLVHHEGPYFRTDGILNLPPSPQRTPLLVQAGASGRGREFAGRNAEAVFVGGGEPATVAANVTGIRESAVAEGRPADAVKILVGALFITAPTSEEAWAKHATMLAMSSDEGAAAIYAGNTGIDLLALDPDKPIAQTETEMGQSNLERYLGKDGKPAPLVRDILENFRRTGINGSVFVGSPDEVADQIEEFVAVTGVDGFLIQPHLTPETYDDLIELLLPVLRERGLARDEYAGDTLRERFFPEGGPHLPGTHRGHAFRAGR